MGKNQKALAYLRVSGESQVDGDGISRQRRAITAWAKRAKYEIIRSYEDLGVSGTKSAEDRPALAQLFADLLINNGQPPVVVIERPDRLSRDLIAGEVTLKRLNELGVQVVIAENGQILNGDQSPTAVLVRQILGAVSEFDRASLVAKLRASRVAKKKKTGRCEGRLLYGTKIGEEKGLEIIRQGKKANYSLSKIADTLNKEKIPTRLGNPWSRSTISNILRRIAL